MRSSIECRYQRFVNGYRFLSFPKNTGKMLAKI